MRTRWIVRMSMPLLIVAALGTTQAQGKGQGGYPKADKAQAKGQTKPDKGQSRAVAKQEKPGKAAKATMPAAARADKPDKALKPDKAAEISRGKPDLKPKEIREFGGTVGRSDFRSFAASNKHGQRLAGRAVARAAKRGVSDGVFVITPVGNRVQVLNPSGVLLLELDDDRDLGVWRVVTAKETQKKGSPSFCRSGAGHPVWGRQWCVDKGFGLGVDNDVRWARSLDVNNVAFRQQVTTGDLTRAVLLDVLGDVVLNRLAAHAITLGLSDPLAGRWIGEPVGPRVLLLTSGPQPIAEIVDINRDDRADLLLVAVRP